MTSEEKTMTAATSKPTSAPVVTPVSVRPYDGIGSNEWSFMYDGPFSPTDVGTCAMCTAASRGACPVQGHNNQALHCSSCQAVRHGHCHNHCGVAKALAEHGNTHVLGPKDQVTFGIVSKTILDAAGALKGSNVYVKAVATESRVSLDIFAR
jgi:hypothetical protein